MFRRRFEGGFRRDGFRAGFRDRWHFPKDGPEGGFGGDFEGLSAEISKGFRPGFGNTCLLPKGLRRGLLGWLVPKGVFEGSFEGWSSGMTLIAGLGINGWDSSFRSDRGEVRSDRPKY